jgi:hypothetical protein
MGVEQIRSRYLDLRAELEAAYAPAEWDSGRIDAIAAELSAVERCLSTRPEGCQTVTALTAGK